jgi:hypothetical protein
MITLHAHPDSLLTFTIEWWDDKHFWVQMFLPNGDSFNLDRATSTYEDALKEGLLVCNEFDKWASGVDNPFDNPGEADIYGHEGVLGGEGSEE